MHFEIDCVFCGKEIGGSNIYFSKDKEPMCDTCIEKEKEDAEESNA